MARRANQGHRARWRSHAAGSGHRGRDCEAPRRDRAPRSTPSPEPRPLTDVPACALGRRPRSRRCPFKRVREVMAEPDLSAFKF